MSGRLVDVKKTLDFPNLTEHNGETHTFFMVSDSDFNWLIEQAGKVERYETAIKTFLDSEPESGEDWEMFVDSIKDYLCGILEGKW